MVSILPQKYFVQKIAGNKFAVNVMVPAGICPESYELTPQQMQALAYCKIYFRIGHIPFEKAYLGKIASTNAQMRIVDTSEGVEFLHGDSHEHHHGHSPCHQCKGDKDPHIWLSPKAVKIQIQHILKTLVEADPQNKNFYQENHAKFIQEIESLDKKIRAIFQNIKQRKFMVYHSAWGYFARDYNLTQIPIEMEGKETNPADLKKLIDTARKENIRVIFLQQQFATHSAQAIASEMGGRVVQLDPLVFDWIANMEKIAGTIREALK
jgi:zinc transport system substrate-binding protein